MSSSTRTVNAVLETLQHLSLASFAQPSPTAPEYNDSIGIELPSNPSLGLKGRRRWIATGKAAEVWQQSLQESIDGIIQENHQTIFRGLNVRPTISRCCWMIGISPDLAQPTAVITSSRQRVLRRLAAYIKRSGILESAKFTMLTFQSSLDVFHGTLQLEIYQDVDTDESQASLCGAQVYSTDSGRLATVGGVIMVDDESYGLTVAHVCAGKNFPRPLAGSEPGKLRGHDSIPSSDDGSEEESDDGFAPVWDMRDSSRTNSKDGGRNNSTVFRTRLHCKLSVFPPM